MSKSWTILLLLFSFSVFNALLLILLVSPRPDRKINLLAGINPRIAEFLGQNTREEENSGILFGTGLISNFVSDIAFFVSISYSVIMVISALARYVFQCKNKNMTVKGQFCYGIYIASNLVARSTVSIAMFSTAEALGKPNYDLKDVPHSPHTLHSADSEEIDPLKTGAAYLLFSKLEHEWQKKTRLAKFL